jgi:hypothetical protein
MTLKVILSMLCCGLVGQAYAGLNLTPLTKEYTEDGVTYREVSFKSGEGSQKFYPPEGWTLRGQETRLQLSPPKTDFAEAVIEVSPSPAAEIDEPVIKAFKEKVLATLPSGSTAVTTISEAQNGLMPSGKPSFEIVVSYQHWGKTYQRSVLLVNGPQEHLIFKLTAVKEDFMVLQTVFRRSVASWQWIDKSPAVVAQNPANANEITGSTTVR